MFKVAPLTFWHIEKKMRFVVDVIYISKKISLWWILIFDQNIMCHSHSVFTVQCTDDDNNNIKRYSCPDKQICKIRYLFKKKLWILKNKNYIR